MDFYLINGGPRKKNNTSKLLKKVNDGINDELTKNNINEININTIRLYDLDYKGCKSCFHCKKLAENITVNAQSKMICVNCFLKYMNVME